VVPGALHAALTVLEKWGTMSFEQVAARPSSTRNRASRCAPARCGDRNQKALFEAWPDNQKYWYKPDGSQYQAGDTIKLPTLARTLTRMVEAERAAKPKGRRPVSSPRATGSTRATSRARWWRSCRSTARRSSWRTSPSSTRGQEAPAQTTYRGYTVYKHGFGSQGPMLLQTLNILEQFDLRAMGYASADYLHTVTEAMKLAYADRDTYYADPAFVRCRPRACCRRPTRRNARRSSIRRARRRRSSPATRCGTTRR
jgi:gamma-glutamyltranspeptidase / glutathione hydrolase